jgi:hypothetical protein
MRRTKSKSRLAFRSPFIRQVLVNAVTGQVKSDQIHMSGNATCQDLATGRFVPSLRQFNSEQYRDSLYALIDEALSSDAVK